MLRLGIGHACQLMGMSFLSTLHQSSGDRKISQGQVNLSSADRKVARYRGPLYKAITYITIFRHRHYRRAGTIVLCECWRDPRMETRVFWECWVVIVRSADYLLESSWIARGGGGGHLSQGFHLTAKLTISCFCLLLHMRNVSTQSESAVPASGRPRCRFPGHASTHIYEALVCSGALSQKIRPVVMLRGRALEHRHCWICPTKITGHSLGLCMKPHLSLGVSIIPLVLCCALQHQASRPAVIGV